MKKLLIVAFTLALGACAAQQSALQSADSAPERQQAQASEDSAAAPGDKRRRSDEPYLTSLERRDTTGSRINRVRRRGEPEEDRTAGKRVETISKEQLEEMKERGRPVVIGGEG